MTEIEQHGPKFEVKQLDNIDTILPFGTVVQYINEGPNGMLLVMPSQQDQIFDIDNIVCLPRDTSDTDISKLVVGFISDLVGPVQMPMYTVVIYKQCKDHLVTCLSDNEDPSGVSLADFFKGKEVCLVEKSLKTINS